MDWLGQAKSWPEDEQSTHGLRYCANNWCDQLEWFLENEILNNHNNTLHDQNLVHSGVEHATTNLPLSAVNHSVYLVGNSLGGFIAVQLARKRPDLLPKGGLILINPTPIWSFQPPLSATQAWRPFGWKANLPAPKLLSSLGSTLFQLMRDENTIKRMLSEVYHDTSQIDDTLIQNIREASSNPLGADAFTSIMFAPKMEKSFEESLIELDAQMPVLLLYGSQDPWVTPFWGDQA